MAKDRDHTDPGRLLSRDDVAPVEVVNPMGRSTVVLTCEHAGRAIPERLGDLGVSGPDMDRHIAYDIGAEGLSRLLSAALDAPLILQRYSRLVVDCNRPLHAPDCMPEVSDGTMVPANRDLDAATRALRYDEIHQPFHDQISRVLNERMLACANSLLLSVHSFTPCLAGVDRPWHAGLLHNRDDRVSRRMMDGLVRHTSGLRVAFNEPYSIDDDSDYTIPVHGEGRGLPHVLLEVRNNEIADVAGQERWADWLTLATRDAVHHLFDDREQIDG